MNISRHIPNRSTLSLLLIIALHPSGSVAMRLTRAALYIPHISARSMSSRIHTTSPTQNRLNSELRKVRAAIARQKDLDAELLLTSYDYAPNVTAFSRLITTGADVNAHDSHGTTPLHVAALAGNPEIVRILLARGAYVNAEYDDAITGPTPLHCATHGMNGSKAEVIKMLIQAGANKAAVDNRWETPFWQAVVHQDQNEIMALITSVAHAASSEVTIMKRCQQELEALQSVLNIRNIDGLTVQQEALRRGKQDIAALVDPNNIKQHQKTLLISLITLHH